MFFRRTLFSKNRQWWFAELLWIYVASMLVVQAGLSFSGYRSHFLHGGKICPIENHCESLFITQCSHPWTDFNVAYVMRRVSTPGSTCYGRVHTVPNIGSEIFQNPNFGVWLRILRLTCTYYRNYCIKSSQILYFDKCQKIISVGGPNTRLTNPRR